MAAVSLPFRFLTLLIGSVLQGVTYRFPVARQMQDGLIPDSTFGIFMEDPAENSIIQEGYNDDDDGCQGSFSSLGYNIDLFPAFLFSNISKQFGYEVLHIGQSPEARIIVGAPGEPNSTGQVYQCDVQSDACKGISFEDTFKMPHFGMTLASDAEGSKMIACGPGVAHYCDKNLHLSGICYLSEAKLNKPRKIITGFQKCMKGNVDLVFLFDGSHSMKRKEFEIIKDAMIDAMNEQSNSTIKFAAVQFSDDVKIEFDFNNYTNNPNPRMLLADVKHMNSITSTHAAIKFVVDDVFIPERGTREGANRAIIIITDGEATDLDRGGVEAARRKGITRFIFGIGTQFSKEANRKNIEVFASEPASEFVKILENFEDLKNSLKGLQSKIYAIEGTSDSSSFHLELSSSGFSADISQGRVVLGAVGADNWAGGLLEQQEGLTGERFITAPLARKEMRDAYLGYAMKFFHYQQREFYAVGAPRYQHVGRVLIFEANPSPANWTLKKELPGEQIGSYFGAVLCSVDVDSNNEADLLLVGAHLHFGEMRGGRVYVYGWEQGDLRLQGELHGDSGFPLGRFGAAITALADINGDGLTDVAVGAPLEDADCGSVYIYNGHKKTLNMHYSQRIAGINVSPGLRFFGRSIHGQVDLTGDGLINMVVGSLGEVVVLRSRPIVEVAAMVRFRPLKIPVKGVICSGDTRSQQDVAIDFVVCFNISVVNERYKGQLLANLTYNMEIDPNRMNNRGVFGSGKKGTKGAQKLSAGSMCVRQEKIHIQHCIEDYVSGVKVLVNFSLEDVSGSNQLHPVLSPLSKGTTVEIPFEKNCGTDEVCDADLRLLFHPSGSKELLVSSAVGLNVTLELENRREDAYHVVLHVPHVLGLSFRRASGVEAIVRCNGMLDPQVSVSLTCNISHPIFRENTKALIRLFFNDLSNSSWGDHLQMEAYVSSENEGNRSLHDNRATLRIPVLYPVNIIAKGLDVSSQYINFSSLNQENKTVTHSYKVENLPLGTFRPPAVTVFVMVPTVFPAEMTWEVNSVRTENSVTCRSVQMNENTTANVTRSQAQLTKECAVNKYRVYQCDLGQIKASVIHVTGKAYAIRKIEHSSRSKFCTALWATFDTRRYKKRYGTEFELSQVTTEVEMIFVMNNLPIIIGSALGGLVLLILIIVGLYKCGFFKRNYKDKMDHQEGETATALQPEGTSNGDKEAEGITEPLNGEVESI